MNEEEPVKGVDAIRQAVVKLVATSPAGHDLLLIGGFRYRFLDHSARTSQDIDYHWAGDLAEKQRTLIGLFRKRLLPELRRHFGYEGRVDAASGPEAESPAVRTVLIAIWKPDPGSTRIEIPVEITRVICADRPEVRTMDGVIYPTLSDADLVESKILAILNRRVLEHRDLVDVFLFANKLLPTSPERLKKKMRILELEPTPVAQRLNDLAENKAYHARAIQVVIATQLDPEAAANIQAAGGAVMALDKALAVIRANLGQL